jgi:chromosome segregation ATPase
MSFISSFGSTETASGYGFGDWGNRFPDDTNTGTENPKTDPEKVQRIQYLENKVYQLKEMVRNADTKVYNAKQKVSDLESKLSQAKENAYNYREKHLSLGRKKAGLEGKRDGNKQKIRDLNERLRHTSDTWTINEIKAEINQRENARWTIADQISNTTDQYYNATEKMNEWDNRVQSTSNTLENARENVWTVKENLRARKEQLAHHQQELSSLKGGGW